MLPQLPHLGGRLLDTGLGYHAEMCLSCDRRVRSERMLDLHGNHACGKCAGAAKGLARRHRNLIQTLERFAKCAGTQTEAEPATSKVLLSLLTPAQCRSLFLKKPNAKQKALTEELVALIQRTISEPSEERVVPVSTGFA